VGCAQTAPRPSHTLLRDGCRFLAPEAICLRGWGGTSALRRLRFGTGSRGGALVIREGCACKAEKEVIIGAVAEKTYHEKGESLCRVQQKDVKEYVTESAHTAAHTRTVGALDREAGQESGRETGTGLLPAARLPPCHSKKTSRVSA